MPAKPKFKSDAFEAIHSSASGMFRAGTINKATMRHFYETCLTAQTAFAPAENPTIALAAIVENAGFGAAHAAPIARRVFDYWLMGEYPSEEDIAAVQKGQASAPIGKPRKASEVPLVAP